MNRQVLSPHSLLSPFLFPAILFAMLLQAGCATAPTSPTCPAGTQDLPDCPPLSAVVDPKIEELYQYRTWKPPKELEEDPIEFGMNADIPIQGARGKILGPDDEGVGWRNLGTCLLRLADPNGAETMYRRAVEAARAHHHEDLASEIEEMIEEL